MAIERASVQVARKPWGVSRSTSLEQQRTVSLVTPIGELRFRRADRDAPAPGPKLLLKLLFTSAPLSIQVHPDDAFAQARSGCRTARPRRGTSFLRQRRPRRVARRIETASRAAGVARGDRGRLDCRSWSSGATVAKGDVLFIPAGTIHALGAGIVLAEIQQRSDTTFRLFDYGRPRHLARRQTPSRLSDAGPARDPTRLAAPHHGSRTLLVSQARTSCSSGSNLPANATLRAQCRSQRHGFWRSTATWRSDWPAASDRRSDLH